MVEPLRHRQTKEADNRYVRPTATAPHLDSTQMRSPAMSGGSGWCLNGRRYNPPNVRLPLAAAGLCELRNRRTLATMDLVWLWFRSPHFRLAARMMRTSDLV